MIELARLSLGVRLPISFTESLQELQTTIRRKAIVDMRWVTPNEFILPFFSLGETSPGVMPRLDIVMNEVCQKTAPFQLRLEGLVGLPNQVQPRYAGVGIAGDVLAFEKFHQELVKAVGTVVKLPEGRLLNPMIMLGRLRQESEQSRVALGRGFRVIQTPDFGPLTIDHIQLMKATAAEGVSSEVVKRYEFGG